MADPVPATSIGVDVFCPLNATIPVDAKEVPPVKFTVNVAPMSGAATIL